jgi:amino acid transporter
VRSLTLTHAVLYGLGVTIGAGIYVLVGIAAGRSGMHAPLAFIGAALVMAFSAASFAELGTRMPVSASEAAYVQAAFGRDWLSLAVGLLVLALAVPIAGLADLTARFTLVVFAIVNLALIRIKRGNEAPPSGAFICPRWVPFAGLVSSALLLVVDFIV